MSSSVASAPTPAPKDADRVEPQGIDVVAPTSWLGGVSLFAAAVCFVLASLAERLLYDVRIFGPSWAFPALLAGGAAWLAMMFVGAQRLRIDDDGLHVRTLLREREVAWGDVQLLGVRPPKLPLVDGILTVVSGYRALSMPLALHAHDDGAVGMLERVSMLAISQGVTVPDADAVRHSPAPS